ncbi:MAG: cytochrome c biogenesis protein CcdA [Acidimicrobiales bacterium]|nr:cytochrome c biogenesis protein CcdA [Acidimicrobiales bacterium]
MISVDLAFPLAAGLIAAFNPCGFAMLPAYLSYFLGLESDNSDEREVGILNGLKVSLTLSLGFVFVFAIIGILTNTIISEASIEKQAGYITLGIGIILVLVGVAMVAGYHPVLNVPRIHMGTSNRQLPSIFLFGISYAFVSIGCSAPIFFLTVGGSFSRDGIINGSAVFISYALGMSIVITVLTVGISIARSSITEKYKSIMKYLNPISGIFLSISGFFLSAYGWWEIQVSRGNYGTNPLVELSLRGSGRLSNWVNDVSGGRFAMACLMIVVGILVWATRTKRESRRERTIPFIMFLIFLLIVEIALYGFNLLIVPILRTMIDFPERISNWFTDPIRWASLWELIAFTLITSIVWPSIKKVFILINPKAEMVEVNEK